jgi:hypothetical protein
MMSLVEKLLACGKTFLTETDLQQMSKELYAFPPGA